MTRPVDRYECKSSGIHGRGLFAKEFIAAGERVIEYVGEIITKRDSLLRAAAANGYIFALDHERDLDGSVEWNEARFINHGCSPNCETRLEQGQVWIVALRDLSAGEEMTFNYGYDLEDYRDHPCHCGDENCVGYIVAEVLFSHVRQFEVRSCGNMLE